MSAENAENSSFVRRTKECSEEQLGLSLSALPESVPPEHASPCPCRKVFLNTSVLWSGLQAGLAFSGSGGLIVFFRPSHQPSVVLESKHPVDAS